MTAHLRRHLLPTYLGINSYDKVDRSWQACSPPVGPSRWGTWSFPDRGWCQLWIGPSLDVQRKKQLAARARFKLEPYCWFCLDFPHICFCNMKQGKKKQGQKQKEEEKGEEKTLDDIDAVAEDPFIHFTQHTKHCSLLALCYDAEVSGMVIRLAHTPLGKRGW